MAGEESYCELSATPDALGQTWMENECDGDWDLASNCTAGETGPGGHNIVPHGSIGAEFRTMKAGLAHETSASRNTGTPQRDPYHGRTVEPRSVSHFPPPGPSCLVRFACICIGFAQVLASTGIASPALFALGEGGGCLCSVHTSCAAPLTRPTFLTATPSTPHLAISRMQREPPCQSFNLMVVGEAGLGKTTLLESFFQSFKDDEANFALFERKETATEIETRQKLAEAGVRRNAAEAAFLGQ